MSRILLFLFAAAALTAAEDSWQKVQELKSGTELRVYKKGGAQPVIAKLDEANADNLVVVVKNEQVAIAKENIDRIEYRPSKPRVTTETKSKTTDPDTTPRPPGYGSRVPGTSTSSGVSIGSKPEFETIYRRPAAPPKK